jgi:hypothetical protein
LCKTWWSGTPRVKMNTVAEVLESRGEGESFAWGYFKFWALDPNLGRFEKT